MKYGHGEHGDLGAVTPAKRTFAIPGVGLIGAGTGWRLWLRGEKPIMTPNQNTLWNRAERIEEE